jgi:hypothetical protein
MTTIIALMDMKRVPEWCVMAVFSYEYELRIVELHRVHEPLAT